MPTLRKTPPERAEAPGIGPEAPPPDPESQSKQELLRKVGIFQDLKSSDAALAALAGIMRKIQFPSGVAIIEEGSEGTKMYILIEGQAGVFKRTPGGDEYKVAILPSNFARHLAKADWSIPSEGRPPFGRTSTAFAWSSIAESSSDSRRRTRGFGRFRSTAASPRA